jgi:hypothetical protein
MGLEELKKELVEYEKGKSRVVEASRLISNKYTPNMPGNSDPALFALATFLLILLIMALVISLYLLFNLNFSGDSISEFHTSEYYFENHTNIEVLPIVEIRVDKVNISRGNVTQGSIDYLNKILEKG